MEKRGREGGMVVESVIRRLQAPSKSPREKSSKLHGEISLTGLPEECHHIRLAAMDPKTNCGSVLLATDLNKKSD